MDRIFSLVFALFMACILQGQIIITNANFPAAGDTLRIAFDTTSAGLTVTAPGGNQSWNFTSVTPAFTRTIPVKAAAEGQNAAAFPAATLVAPAAGNGENYYRVTPSIYELIGFAGGDPLGFGIDVRTPFNPPLLERRAPLNFFDVNPTNAALLVPFDADDLPAALLNLLPITPDSIRLRVAISRIDIVDGWGALTIPGGTYPVLRERRTTYTDTRIDIKVGIFPWTDITALIPLPGAGLGRDTSLNYYFWSNTAKEPIAVVEADHVTNAVLSVQYKFNGIISSAGLNNAGAVQVKVMPNPAAGSTRIELVDVPAGIYDLRIINLAGQTLHRQRAPVGTDFFTVDIDLEGFQPGIYLLALADTTGNLVHVGKLTVISGR